MGFQNDPAAIRWRLHLASPPAQVYEMLATDGGRARFWAESAVEQDGKIYFVFPNGMAWVGQVLQAVPGRAFAVRYIGSSEVVFTLETDGQGGTDLTLIDRGVPEVDRAEVAAGWVSVLLALKAAVDFGVDLRAHNRRRSWDHGYVEN